MSSSPGAHRASLEIHGCASPPHPVTRGTLSTAATPLDILLRRLLLSSMDLTELDEMSGGCEGKNCGLAPELLQDCFNQECYWEEPMFGPVELVCVTLIYIPLMLFGLLGNILTILVVWLRPHMRSSTYFYLSSMAVSDLLILLLLPLDLYKLWRPRPWPLGDLACKLTMFISECCTFCTILHITFLSLERYLAVCWPITAKTLVTRRRTRLIIGCLWLGAAVSAAPVLVMVGVEDIGGEELGPSQWREEGGWSAAKHGGSVINGGDKTGAHMISLDDATDGMKLAEEEPEGWGEGVRDSGWFGDEVTGDSGKDAREKNDPQREKGREETKMEDEENKKKEDEGGGSRGGDTDSRECRCTDYAISSGLLSAMMILSNLYFLVPLCILALVYSLIGRTLWLRPKSSRRDQSHRNTVKMLGVIVLAFILCWLPFHVGRTIFSLSLDSGADRSDLQGDANMEANDGLVHPEAYFFQPLIQSQLAEDSLTEKHLSKEESNTAETPQSERQNSNADTTKQSLHVPVSCSDSGSTNTHVKTQLPNNRSADTHSTNTHTVSPADTHNDTNSTHPNTHTYFLYYLSQYFNLVSSILFYLSAAVNPLLYNLMSARYRLAVQSLVHKCSHTHRLGAFATRRSTTRRSSSTL